MRTIASKDAGNGSRDQRGNTHMSASLYFLRNGGIVKLPFQVDPNTFYLSFRNGHTIQTHSDRRQSWEQVLAE